MTILIDREKVFTIKILCLGHNWGYLGAPLCAYIFALGWCVTVGFPIQPGNACTKSNSQYFKSKLAKLPTGKNVFNIVLNDLPGGRKHVGMFETLYKQ